MVESLHVAQAVNPPHQRMSSMQQGHSQPLAPLHHSVSTAPPHANLNAPPPPPLGGRLPRLVPHPPLAQHHDASTHSNFQRSRPMQMQIQTLVQQGDPQAPQSFSSHFANAFQQFPHHVYMGHSGLAVPEDQRAETSRQKFPAPSIPFNRVSNSHSPLHHADDGPSPPFPSNQQVGNPFPGRLPFHPHESIPSPYGGHVYAHAPLHPLGPPLPPIEQGNYPISPPLPPLYGPHNRSFSLQQPQTTANASAASSPPMFHNSLPSRFLNGDYLGSTPPLHLQGSPSRVGFGDRFPNAPFQQPNRGGGGVNTASRAHLPLYPLPRTQLHERTQSAQFGPPRSSRADERTPSVPGSILPRISVNQGLRGIQNQQHHHRLSLRENPGLVGGDTRRASQSRFLEAAEIGSPLGSHNASSTGLASRENRVSQTPSSRALSQPHFQPDSKNAHSVKPVLSLPFGDESQRTGMFQAPEISLPRLTAQEQDGPSKHVHNTAASTSAASTTTSPSPQHAKVVNAPLNTPSTSSLTKKKKKKKGNRPTAVEAEMAANCTQSQNATAPPRVPARDNAGIGSQSCPPPEQSNAIPSQSADKTSNVQHAKLDKETLRANSYNNLGRDSSLEMTTEEYPFYLGNVGYHPCQNAQCTNVFSYLREASVELDETTTRHVGAISNSSGTSAQHTHLSTVLVPDFIPPPAWARLSICGCTLCRDCFSEVIANCRKEPPATTNSDAQSPRIIDSPSGAAMKRFSCTVCSSTVSDFEPVNLALTMATQAEKASAEAEGHLENVMAVSGHVDAGHAIVQAPLEAFDDFVSAQAIARPADSALAMDSRRPRYPAGGHNVVTNAGPEAGQLDLATISTSEGTTEGDPALESALNFPSLYDPSHVVKVSLPIRKVSAASMDSADSPVPPTPDLVEACSSSASSSAPPSPEITLSPQMALPVVHMPFKGRMEGLQASFSEKTQHITHSETSMASLGLGMSFDSSALPILTSGIVEHAAQNDNSRSATPATPLTGNPIPDQAISTPRGAKSLTDSRRSPARAAMADRAVQGHSGTWPPSGPPRSRTNTDTSRHSRQSSSSSGNSSYTRKVSAGENRQGGRLPAIFANPTPEMVSQYEASRTRWWLDPWTGCPMGIKQGKPNRLGTSVMRRSDGKMLVKGQAANVSWPILKVHNISFDTTITDIEAAVPPQTLAPLLYNAQAIHLLCNVLDGQTLPYAYMECISDDAADQVMQELNGKFLAGRQIAVRPVTQKELVMDLYPSLRQAGHPPDSVLLAEYEKASAWTSGQTKDDATSRPQHPVSSITKNNLVLFSHGLDTQLRALVDAALDRGHDQRVNHQEQHDNASSIRGPLERPFARLASMIVKYPCRLVDGCPPAGIAVREAELKRLFDCLLYTLERLCRDIPFLSRITGTCKALFRAGLYCPGFSIQQRALLKKVLDTYNRNLPPSEAPLVP